VVTRRSAVPAGAARGLSARTRLRASGVTARLHAAGVTARLRGLGVRTRRRAPGVTTWPRALSWRRLGLRARLTLAATAVLAVGLTAGGLMLLAIVRSSLLSALDQGAMQSAREVVALVDAGRLSAPVPVGGPTKLVQVVDGRGRVRAASAGADRLVPLLRPGELGDPSPRFLPEDRTGPYGSPLRVVAVPAGPPGDPQTVVVAVGAGGVLDSLEVVRTAVVTGFPVLLALLAVLSWLVVGLALRPVEALRTGAAEITGAGTGRRLPVPGAHDEIHRLALTLNDMIERLERARRRQRVFVADAAHELRSPLASLRTQLEVAERRVARGGAPVTAGALADLVADTERLSRLVDDLLLLARVDDTGAGVVRFAPVDVSALVRDMAGRYAGQRVPVVVNRRVDGLRVSGDADQLRRVLGNLLDNAVRHAARRVEVSAAADGAELVLVVADDGAGIRAGDREQAFARFTRLDDGRGPDEGGTGLGLAIVRELVRAHGGTVRLEDAGLGAGGLGLGAAGPGPGLGAAGPGLRVEVRLPALAAAPSTS
jgi:signal transduction histidine kinase